MGLQRNVFVGDINTFLIAEKVLSGELFFYIYLNGPELVMGTMCDFKNGTIAVKFTLSKPGVYNLNVVLKATYHDETNINKPIFGSPFGIYAEARSGGASAPVNDIQSPPPRNCNNATAMTNGRWVLQDSSALQQYNVLARDAYTWVPEDGCTILQRNQTQMSDVLRGKTLCWAGDSYARTLLAGLMFYTGRFTEEELKWTEYPNRNRFPHETWVVRNATMAMRYTAGAWSEFRKCLQNADMVIIETVVDKKAAQSALKEALHFVQAHQIVVVGPHAWCSDQQINKRINPILEHDSEILRYVTKKLNVSFFDAYAMSIPRLDKCIDGSHFVRVSESRLTFFLWEAAILIQSVFGIV
eukprot:CAMPEP_0175030298 /NCGR_PEP_ID=MMETSP0005-20121125/20139_1 /TAXON_ID=420556 /ORGANISM="Ochromonas sp., Strain CCMP1393" /LENGTH=355 /DNA_ID=CAMNT_0016290335 /DNA_START=311 /DNA_END=1378 /DNA_ORIENTATION=+